MDRNDMVITEDALNRVDQHWAVKAVGDDPLARAMAYEIAAIEGLDALVHPSSDEASVLLRMQAQAGAFRAYAMRRTVPIPTGPEDRIFHVLHLAALAYCGNQWDDLQRWFNDHDQEIKLPSVAECAWDHRVLQRLYDCWIRLCRNRGRDDLEGVREIIAGLRTDQEQYENTSLNQYDIFADKAKALRLVALYHLAKATELLATYMLQDHPGGIESAIDKHFEAGRQAASAAHDIALDMILRWLHASSRRMVGR